VRRPDDHPLAQQLLEQRPRVLAQVAVEEVRHGRPGRLEAVFAQDSLDLRPLRGVLEAAAFDFLRVADARERGFLCGGRDVEGAAHLPERGDNGGRAERVADAKPGKPEDLRERPQDDDPAPILQVLRDPVGVVRLLDVLEVRLVEDGEDVVGNAVEVGIELRAGVHRPGWVVRVADVDELRPGGDRAEHRLEVVALVAQGH
jgi:hypothetical protein